MYGIELAGHLAGVDNIALRGSSGVFLQNDFVHTAKMYRDQPDLLFYNLAET
ncbi:MAG: hypothetical protein R2757_21970 [Draconibacterium sp.]